MKFTPQDLVIKGVPLYRNLRMIHCNARSFGDFETSSRSKYIEFKKGINTVDGKQKRVGIIGKLYSSYAYTFFRDLIGSSMSSAKMI